MKIDKTQHDDYAILTLRGEFDTFFVPTFLEEVEGLAERGISHLILNLRLVKFVNSTALGAMIKAYKRCQAEGGDLVIAHPSAFVRDVMGKVGIDKLINLHDTEEAAIKATIKRLNQRDASDDSALDREKVLLWFDDETRNKMIGPSRFGQKRLLGTVLNVNGERMQFSWNGATSGLSPDQAKQLFFPGGSVNVKFQVRMIKKGFFDLRATVEQVTSSEDGVRVTAQFAGIGASDQAALQQFAADMAFLKNQLPS